MPDAYIDVAFGDAYHAKYTTDPSAWTGVGVPEKEAAIIRATQFLDNELEPLMKGARAVAGQDLAYPRSGLKVHGHFVDSTTVPIGPQQATAEIAIRYLEDPNSLMPDGDNTGTVKKKSIRIGPISKSTTYTSAGNRDQAVRTKVYALMRPYLKPRGRLSRG